jgi:hypothetical protein
MLSYLTMALFAVVLVAVVPGYFWAVCLRPTADFVERLAYSIGLSISLVPATALVSARLVGSGVTLAVAGASAALVFLDGLGVSFWFKPVKSADGPLPPCPTPLSLPTLIVLIAALERLS